jgi:hypothetical protein
MTETNIPDFESFAKDIMESFDFENDIDGYKIHDLAKKHHLVREVKFDPEIHGEHIILENEESDLFLELNY